jgi:hypothetical protein
MAKMKITPDSVSVVKKTLTLGAPTGGVKPTPDSTSFFKSESMKYAGQFSDLFDQKVKELRKYGATEDNAYAGAFDDPQVKLALKKSQIAGISRDRQANKGKEGFDKNGYPLPTISEATKKSVAAKLTGNK